MGLFSCVHGRFDGERQSCEEIGRPEHGKNTRFNVLRGRRGTIPKTATWKLRYMYQYRYANELAGCDDGSRGHIK